MPRRLKPFLFVACLLAGVASAAADPAAPALAPVTATALPASPTARGGFNPAGGMAKGFDESLPLDIQGGKLSYRQGDETLLAEGNVALASGPMTVHADRLWYDMKKGTLRAEGQVVIDLTRGAVRTPGGDVRTGAGSGGGAGE